MNRKLSKRFPTDLMGVIIYEEKSYVGNLKNVSEGGVGYLISTYISNKKGIAPKKIVHLVFSDPSNTLLGLNCEIIWHSEHSNNSSKAYLGLKILNPPKVYKDFVHTLESSKDLKNTHSLTGQPV